MTYLIKSKPLNRWDYDSIRPGPVGSVGDVNLQVKLKKSTPSLPNRWLPETAGKNEVYYGSNVSDGSHYGYSSGGFGAKTVQSGWNYKGDMKTAYGWYTQDIRAADRSKETVTQPLGRYGWENDVGTVLKAKVTGEQFLPLPGGYGPADEDYIPRGSRNPRVVGISEGDGVPLPAVDVDVTDPEFGKTGSTGGVGTKPEPWELAADTIWTPAMDDPVRQRGILWPTYHYGDGHYAPNARTRQYPAVGRNQDYIRYSRRLEMGKANFSPWGKVSRPANVPNPTYIPPRAKEGDYRKTPSDSNKA